MKLKKEEWLVPAIATIVTTIILAIIIAFIRYYR